MTKCPVRTYAKGGQQLRTVASLFSKSDGRIRVSAAVRRWKLELEIGIKKQLALIGVRGI